MRVTLRSGRRLGAPLVAVAVALPMALTACGSSASDNATPAGGQSSAGGQKVTSLTVGTPGTYPSLTPLYLAKDKGLFAKQGLDVKVVAFQGGSDMVKAVAGGSVGIGVTALAGVLQAINQGADLKAVYGGFDQAPFNWYGRSLSWADAKGTKWGVSKIGSSSAYLTRYLIEQHGLDARTEVKLVQTGGGSGTINALKSSQVDFGLLAPALGAAVEPAGLKVVARQSDLMDEYPYHVVFAKSDFIAANHDVVQRFLRGLVAGMKLAKSDPQAGQQELVSRVKASSATAKATYHVAIDHLHPDGQLPDPASMETFWKIGIENGQFQHKLPQSQWLDRTWMDSYPDWTR